MNIKKAVFPSAGFGTRFLPATKAIPKEMLPIVDKPLIQYAVEEAKASGLEEIIVVTGMGKTAIEDHFDTSFELELLLKEGGEHGIINRTEQDLIQSVFKFTDISVREVMVPRVRMVTLRTGMTLSEIIGIFSENRYSRYPVLRAEGEEVAGILYYKDLVELLNAPGTFRIDKVLHTPYFVPESMKVPYVLKEMQKRRTQMALVLDEYGALDGLVTMEDLLEEIVGEIEDESDEVAKPVERLRDGSYLVDASLSIRDLSEDYRIHIPEGEDYETLAGFVLSQLQTIPRGGEFFFSKNMKITVVEVDRQRVSRVRIEFLDAPASPGTSDTSGKPSAESSTKPSGGALP